ncbi:hypothetical protein CCACVL1_25754 [Corchorus capsularis]|uniref:Uncharacterized protein n=1 Tax=Corchorus capsularis TaxID=210143 RepID=A0A1R3GHE1_COCAP|nr:hypothetical protein CCACVL1_25754 [Corchorus capsularis]
MAARGAHGSGRARFGRVFA